MSNGNGSANIPGPVKWLVYTFDKVGVSGGIMLVVIAMLWQQGPALMDALAKNLHTQTETLRAVEGSVANIDDSLESVDKTMTTIEDIERENQTFMPQVLADHQQCLADHQQLCAEIELVKQEVTQ